MDLPFCKGKLIYYTIGLPLSLKTADFQITHSKNWLILKTLIFRQKINAEGFDFSLKSAGLKVQIFHTVEK